MIVCRAASCLLALTLVASFLIMADTTHARPGMTVQDRLQQGHIPDLAERSSEFERGVTAYDAGDYEAAFQIWLPLAQNDDLAAMRNVALLLRQGKGTTRDPLRALYFYERAARGGLTSAQVNSAFMHLQGDGIPQDYKKASFWFHAAAISGVPVACYNLAVLYENGLGVERDPARALAWYALAAQAGHEKALERLTLLVPALPGPPPPSEFEAGAVFTTPPMPPAAQLDQLDGAVP